MLLIIVVSDSIQSSMPKAMTDQSQSLKTDFSHCSVQNTGTCRPKCSAADTTALLCAAQLSYHAFYLILKSSPHAACYGNTNCSGSAMLFDCVCRICWSSDMKAARRMHNSIQAVVGALRSQMLQTQADSRAQGVGCSGNWIETVRQASLETSDCQCTHLASDPTSMHPWQQWQS